MFTHLAKTGAPPWQVSSPGKARLFEFISALTDQPVVGSRARAVHSSGGAAGGVVSESQGWPRCHAKGGALCLGGEEETRMYPSVNVYIAKWKIINHHLLVNQLFVVPFSIAM